MAREGAPTCGQGRSQPNRQWSRRPLASAPACSRYRARLTAGVRHGERNEQDMSLIALRERHIDRLLSEELEASPAFAAWFSRTGFGARVPEAEPTSCSTTIGHHRVAGETDILVKLGWGSGTSAIIHVEDMLGALPQPDQALRYAMAVRQIETISPVQVPSLPPRPGYAVIHEKHPSTMCLSPSKRLPATLGHVLTL